MPPSHSDADVRRYTTLLIEANAFGGSLAEFDRVAPGLDVRAWLRTDDFRAGPTAFGRLVAAYVESSPLDKYFADRRLFSHKSDSDCLAAFDAAIWSTTVALLAGGRTTRFDVDAALRLAFGADPRSQLFSSALGGRLFLPPPGGGDAFPPFPDIRGGDRIPFDKLNQLACYGGLRGALTEVGQAAAAIGRTKPYLGMTIHELHPRNACSGDVIRVIGTGFGTGQPKDAIVVFGSTRADVVRGSWISGTEFSVRVPPNVCECCVSVLQVPTPTTTGTGTLSSAMSDLAGVITECFGKVGIAVGTRLEGLANRMPDNEEAVCAPDESNKFVGGVPRITSFRTSFGVASPQRVLPGRPLELEWSLVNARYATITITPNTSNSPLAVIPSLPSWFVPNPVSGRTALGTVPGLVPWKADVSLRATNPCGSISQSIEIEWNPAPGFVFVGGGMRSSFDLGAIEALGALLPVGPAVCAGTGLGALSAACAAADYPNPTSLRAFWDASTDDSSWYVPNAALLTPGGDHAAIITAEWQARTRAEVLSMDALGLLRAFMVPHRYGDGRQLEGLIAKAAGTGADKVMDGLGTAAGDAIEEAGQGALSYVPIVAIVWAAAKFAFTAFTDSMKQHTANLLGSMPNVFDDSGLRGLITTATAGIDQRLVTSGRRVRIPLTSLERGRALYGLEGAAISEAPVGSLIRANTTMGQVVQASATVPLLGAPKQVGSDSYVDGSLRDPVPIGATEEAGAGIVIIIQPHIRLMAERPPFATAGLPRVDARTSVLRDTQFLDGAVNPFGRFAHDPTTGAPVGSWSVPVFVIEPTVDLIGLGASVGQSGLTNVMIDYGYMRAYDAIVPWLLFPREAQRTDREAMLAELAQSTDKIIGLRVTAWEHEHRLNAMRATPFGPTSRLGGLLVAVPQGESIIDIRTAKTEIRTALVDRLAIPGRYEPRAMPTVPSGTISALPIPKPRAETWVQEWEKHNFSHLVAPSTVTPAKPYGDPWVSLSYGLIWTEPAGTRPPLIWP